MFTSAWTHSQ